MKPNKIIEKLSSWIKYCGCSITEDGMCAMCSDIEEAIDYIKKTEKREELYASFLNKLLLLTISIFIILITLFIIK